MELRTRAASCLASSASKSMSSIDVLVNNHGALLLCMSSEVVLRKKNARAYKRLSCIAVLLCASMRRACWALVCGALQRKASRKQETEPLCCAPDAETSHHAARARTPQRIIVGSCNTSRVS